MTAEDIHFKQLQFISSTRRDNVRTNKEQDGPVLLFIFREAVRFFTHSHATAFTVKDMQIMTMTLKITTGCSFP